MAEETSSPSPLDPFLVQFLAIIERSESGFQPGPESIRMASRMDLPRPFIDALFTSARIRGLIKPMYGRGNKIRWAVSAVGQEFMRNQVS